MKIVVVGAGIVGVACAHYLSRRGASVLLVDRDALHAAQQEDDAVHCEEILRAAYDTDVRPLLAQVRLEQGAEIDPLGAYRSSGYFERIAAERQGELEGAASWG